MRAPTQAAARLTVIPTLSPAHEPYLSRLTQDDKRVLVETGRWLLDQEENPNATKVKDWPSLMKYASGRVEEISN